MNYERIYDNIRFSIDRERYFENYMEIRRTCIMEGYAPPQYLDELLLEIPDAYYVEGDDGFEYLLTDEARERLEETLMSRRRELACKPSCSSVYTKLSSPQIHRTFSLLPSLRV